MSLRPPKRSTAVTWKTVVKRALPVLVSGLVLYFVFPKVIEVFVAWPRLSTLNFWWFVAAIAAEVSAFLCTFALKRLALRTRSWFPVTCAALTGNAVTNIFPGGDAAGAAVEYRMLGEAGINAATAIGGLTAFSFLQVASLFALPILSLPAILAGTPVSRSLSDTVYLGLAVFAFLAIFGVVAMTKDWLLRLVGTAAEDAWNAVVRVIRHGSRVHGLAPRLLSERDSIRTVLGQKWREAVLLCVGRLGFDFLALLATLSATGSKPRASIVLLAYAAASVIGLFPLTPGGLGIVEASLSSLLVVAGIGASRAYLATLAYRLIQYWLPILAGPVAYLAFRRRYHVRRGHGGAEGVEAPISDDQPARPAGDESPQPRHG